MTKILLRSIVPNKIFDLDKFDRESQKVLNDIVKKAETEFKKTTATWRRKPDFIIKRASGSKLEASVYTTDEIYGYVVRGTRAHIITPKRAPALRFQTGFTSKTIPRKIGSRSRGQIGASCVGKIGKASRHNSTGI